MVTFFFFFYFTCYGGLECMSLSTCFYFILPDVNKQLLRKNWSVIPISTQKQCQNKRYQQMILLHAGAPQSVFLEYAHLHFEDRYTSCSRSRHWKGNTGSAVITGGGSLIPGLFIAGLFCLFHGSVLFFCFKQFFFLPDAQLHIYAESMLTFTFFLGESISKV